MLGCFCAGVVTTHEGSAESECVGGRVKNECHFQCMNAVVCVCVCVCVCVYHQEGTA